MPAIIIGMIAGMVAAAITFPLLGGGIPALFGALITAALAYVAGSSLAAPDRKVGDMTAELVPDGVKAADAVDAANATIGNVTRLKALIRDEDIRRECDEFTQGLHALVAYVERNPAAYATLRHYDMTYGPQVTRLLGGYADVEASGAEQATVKAKAATTRALDDVERAAAGELDRAVRDRTLALDADASAIQQLTAMDGYRTPRHAAAAEDKGVSE